MKVSRHLAGLVAVGAARLNLDGSGSPHPGDDFGTVLWWLWSSGNRATASDTVRTYLVRMRHEDPDAPASGHRLTWPALRQGIRHSIHDDVVTAEDVTELLDFLEQELEASGMLADVQAP